MSLKNKRSKYIKKEGHKKVQKKSMYIIGLSTFIGILTLLIVLSNPGRNFLSSLFEKENLVFTPVNTQENTSIYISDSGNINTNKKDQVAETNTSLDKQIKDEKKSDNPLSNQVKDTYITIPLSDLSRKGTYFSHISGNNIEIKFFSLLDTTGQPHVAFDACDVCFRAKKGYAIQGDRAICKNCGNSYPVEAIGTENKFGGCWPSYLPMEITGNEIMIKVKDIEANEYMFI